MEAEELERLQVVLERPDDDLPRLVYADWLEENAGPVPCERCKGKGGYPAFHLAWQPCPDCLTAGTVSDTRRERAEFVRVQVELARLEAEWEGGSRAGKHARRDALRRRERELWKVISKTVFPEFFAYLERSPWEATVRLTLNPEDGTDFVAAVSPQTLAFVSCGFVKALALTAADWMAHADSLTAAHPITEVALTTEPELESVVGGYRLPGRSVTSRRSSMTVEMRLVVNLLLAAEWPRIKFTLPGVIPPRPTVPFIGDSFVEYVPGTHGPV